MKVTRARIITRRKELFAVRQQIEGIINDLVDDKLGRQAAILLEALSTIRRTSESLDSAITALDNMTGGE